MGEFMSYGGGFGYIGCTGGGKKTERGNGLMRRKVERGGGIFLQSHLGFLVKRGIYRSFCVLLWSVKDGGFGGGIGRWELRDPGKRGEGRVGGDIIKLTLGLHDLSAELVVRWRCGCRLVSTEDRSTGVGRPAAWGVTRWQSEM